MNTKSIRFRIIIWYSLTLFLASAFIFLSFYLVTRQILFVQIDKELASHTNKLVDILSRQGLNTNESMLKQQLASEFSDIPGMVIVLMDKDGNIVQSSITSHNPYETYTSIFKKVKDQTTPVYYDQRIANSPMRFIGQSLKSENNLLGVILVAHPVEAIQKSLDSLLATLGIVFAMLIIPTILGVRILAGKIMEPVLKISQKMENITSQHLDERIINPHTNDEIETLATSFNNLLDRLGEAFGRERQFIGDVAHELKTPVATIRSGLELTLSSDRTVDEYKQSLNDSLIDSARLSTIIKNILDLAWVGAENNNKETSFNLSKSILDIKDTVQALAFQKKIVLKTKIESGIIIMGSEDKIQKAVLNIIDNAVKYTPENGSVSLKLSKNNVSAVIEVKDSGVGIPEKELPHIFDRFYRGSKTAKALGSGLGLAIALGIIKAHDGEIKIESRVGKGTVATIFLPLASS